jgi:hypothetical protein
MFQRLLGDTANVRKTPEKASVFRSFPPPAGADSPRDDYGRKSFASAIVRLKPFVRARSTRLRN